MRSGRSTALVVLGAAWFTLGGKCIPYDPALESGVLQPSGDGDVVPAELCDDPNEAQILVEEYAFVILCGCQEPPWDDGEGSRACTVPAGTRVVWTFAGSLAHSVNPAAGSFPSSQVTARGTHAQTFPAPGIYPYACSLHPVEMSSYSVVVR